MKNATFYLSLIIGFLGAAGMRANSQNPRSPLSMVITGPTTAVRLGSRLELRIEIRNNTEKPIPVGGSFRSEGVDTSFRYDCEDSSGKPLTKDPSGIGSLHEVPLLGAEKSREEIVDLNRACSFSIPGSYTVQVSYDNPDDANKPIKSNIVSIVVSP
jgi:hypothetical protein